MPATPACVAEAAPDAGRADGPAEPLPGPAPPSGSAENKETSSAARATCGRPRREQLAADLNALIAAQSRLLRECESGENGDAAADEVVALSHLIGRRQRALAKVPELAWGAVRVHYTKRYYDAENDVEADVGLSFSLSTREWHTQGAPHPPPSYLLHARGRPWQLNKRPRTEVAGAAELPPAPPHSAVVAVDGRILALGGREAGEFSSSDVLELDSHCGAWQLTKLRLPMRFSEHSAVAIGGYVYVFGGTADNENGDFGYNSVGECLRLNPRTGAWSPRSHMPDDRARYYPHVAVGVGDVIFVLESHCRGEPIASDDWVGTAWLYHPGANRWEALPAPPVSVPGVALEWAPDG